MLANLHVKNLALIEEAEVEFGPGLNILTGETGAGKSILMGAVNLALGAKAQGDMLRDPEKPALVELIFTLDHPETVRKLADRGVMAEDGQLFITRKLTGGRSIFRVNGETCTAAHIRGIASLLLDIHGQHEHQSLLYADRQLAILDAYGGAETAGLIGAVREAYRDYTGLKRELDACGIDEETRRRELSFLTFVVNEIDGAALCAGEDEKLEERYRKASNSREILETTARTLQYLDDESGALMQVGRAIGELSHAARLDTDLGPEMDALYDMESVLSDFARGMQDYAESLSFSDEEFQEMDQRLTLINNLKAKYGRTIADILEYREEKQRELERLEHLEERREELLGKTAKAFETLDAACRKLTEARRDAANRFSAAIREGLLDLNFPGVAFEIAFTELKQPTAVGRDAVSFLLSTNPGEPVRELAKIASGGELSRIMLAIRALLADKDETETLIFDEIDTGISGRTAQKVSEKMSWIGRNRQVICITHLPQIAAMADCHFAIDKSVGDGKTTTRIHRLDGEESARELARLLGGARITSHTLESAREMREQAMALKITVPANLSKN